MSLNATPSSERLQIGFFGLRNAGKSSLVNAVTGQEISLVSEVKGTTTDPVKKAMELLPLGPVVIIDTPGLDDEGYLGEQRVRKAREILRKINFAVLVVDATKGVGDIEKELIGIFKAEKTPYIIAYNKSDLTDGIQISNENEISVSAKTRLNIDLLKNKIAELAKSFAVKRILIDDLVNEGDVVVLVTPIDESAPKGRIILPQQLVLRNLLDNNCIAVFCKETELEQTLQKLSAKPALVITDSQVFSYVAKRLPQDIPLTSFSIILARYKGDLIELVKGAVRLKNLSDGDKILISEGCTHHRQCNDIGTVKLPDWIRNYCEKDVVFEFTSGTDFPSNLSEYKLIVHCGGCMLNDKEMAARIETCRNNNVPMVNYGVAIALMHGILERSIGIFPDALRIINGNGDKVNE